MAYPQGSYTIGSPGPTPRPAVVTWAGMLLYAVAGLLVVSAITAFAETNAVVDGIRQAYANDPDLDRVVSFAKGAIAGVAVVFLVIATLYVILAVFDLKGRNGMRITTWVIAGIGVLCFGLGTGGRTGGTIAQTQSNGRQVTVNVDVPSGIATLGTIVNILGVICLIAVIILLALPSSNDFFRRNKGLVIVPGYPQYTDPSYPQYPGYPPVQPPNDPNAR